MKATQEQLAILATNLVKCAKPISFSHLNNTEKINEFYSRTIEVTESQLRRFLEVGDKREGAPKNLQKTRISAGFASKLLFSYYKLESNHFRNFVFKHFYRRCKKNCGSFRRFNYGEECEDLALREYSRKTGVNVCKIGDSVNPMCPIFIAKPDGIVFGSHRPKRILEVKSPQVGKRIPAEKLVFNMPKHFIARAGGSSFYLSTNSEIYTQLQITMFTTGTPKADLVLYSSFNGDIKIIEVLRDNQFLARILNCLSPIIESKVPKHNLLSLTKRLESFEHSEWPKHLKAKTQLIAEAGFYSAWKTDNVICFWCGVGLKEFEVDDDPWLDHAIFSTGCGFLHMNLKNEYLAVCQTLTKWQNSSWFKNLLESGYTRRELLLFLKEKLDRGDHCECFDMISKDFLYAKRRDIMKMKNLISLKLTSSNNIDNELDI